jgi:hypothetical protein
MLKLWCLECYQSHSDDTVVAEDHRSGRCSLLAQDIILMTLKGLPKHLGDLQTHWLDK